jgi:hypothetical protein
VSSAPPPLREGLGGALLLYVGLGLVLLAGALLGWERIGGKDWNYFLGQTQAEVTSILQYGQVPLWTPWRVGGQPTLGQPETMLLSPVTPLALLFGTLTAFKLLLLPVFVLGCLGLHALARDLGLRGRARLVPALVFFGSSIYPLYVVGGWPNWLCGLALLPWLLLACRRATDDLRWIPLAALLYAGLLFCGSIYQFVFVPVFLAVEAVGRCLVRRGPRPLLVLAAVGLLGALLAAPRLLPLFEIYGAYPRLKPTVEDFLPPSLLPEVWLQADLPDLSTPRSPIVVRPDGAAYWVYVGNYVGPLALALAAFGALALRRAFAWALAGGACLWLAFGTAVRPSLWDALHSLPVYGSMHAPQRLVMLTTFSLAILAGLGYERLSTRILSHLPKAGARAVGWLVLALLVLPMLVVNAPIAREAFTLEPTPGLVHGAFRQRNLPARPEQWGGENYEAVLANTGSVFGFSDIPSPRAAVPDDDPDYRGEVHLLEGHGDVSATITPNRIEVDASLDAPDRLIVNQVWFPGWHAEGDLTATLEPHEHLLSLPLPAGRSRLTLAYRPRSVPLGLAYGVAAACVAALWWIARRGAPVTRVGRLEWISLASCLALAAGMNVERPRLEVATVEELEPPRVIGSAHVVDGAQGGSGVLQDVIDAAVPGDVLLVRPGVYDAPRLWRSVAIYAQPGGTVAFEGPMLVEALPAGQFITLVGRDDAPLELHGPLTVVDCDGIVTLQSVRLAPASGVSEAALRVEASGAILMVDGSVAPGASTAPAAIVARDAALDLRRVVVQAPPRPDEAQEADEAVGGAAGIELEGSSLLGTDLQVEGGDAPRGEGGTALSARASRLLLHGESLVGGRGASGLAPPFVLRDASRAELSAGSLTGAEEVDEASACETPGSARPTVRVLESSYLGRSVLLDVMGPPGAVGVILLGLRPAVGRPGDAWSLSGVDLGADHVVLPLALPDDGRRSLRTRIPARLVQSGTGLFVQVICERTVGSGEPWMGLADGRLFSLTDEP